MIVLSIACSDYKTEKLTKKIIVKVNQLTLVNDVKEEILIFAYQRDFGLSSLGILKVGVHNVTTVI